MTTNSKLGTFEAICLVLTVIIATTLLSLPRNLLTSTKSATIINTIYISIIALFIVFCILHLFKRFPGLDIIDITETSFGKIFKNILGFLFIAYFLFTSSILLRNFCESLKILYYPMTNIIFIVLIFSIAIGLANRLAFDSTFKINLIIIPIAVITIFLLFIGNIKNFIPQNIFPILGDGWNNTFILGIKNLSCFSAISYLYFLPPLLKEPKKFKNISYFSIIISSIYLLLCIATILLMFTSFINTNEAMPLFSAARYIEFGSFFQRLESIFLFIWILSFACYLNTCFKFSLYIFKKITNIKDVKPLVYIFSFLSFSIAMLPKNFAISNFIESNVFRIIIFIFIFAVSLLILVFANLKKVGDSHE